MKCQGPPWQYIGTIFQLKGPLALFAICYLVPRKKQSNAGDVPVLRRGERAGGNRDGQRVDSEGWRVAEEGALSPR